MPFNVGPLELIIVLGDRADRPRPEEAAGVRQVHRAGMREFKDSLTTSTELTDDDEDPSGPILRICVRCSTDRRARPARRPHECCGLSLAGGEAPGVHPAESLAASPFALRGGRSRAVPDARRDRGRRRGARRDLPLAHALEPYPSQTDVNFPAAGRSGVDHRRPLEDGRARRAVLPHRRGEVRRLSSSSDCDPWEKRTRSVSACGDQAAAQRGELVRVIGASNQAEAEMIQGMLLKEACPRSCAARAAPSPRLLAAGRATCSCPRRACSRRARCCCRPR